MDLMRYLPHHIYHDEEHVAELTATLSAEVQKLLDIRDDLYRQLRPSTATWGMTFHEQDYAITSESTKPIEQRLSAWRAKRRGRGTTTVELLKVLAESFANGEVEVVEYPDEYRIEIRFVSMLGMPPNLSDLKAAVAEIVPAHLGVSYVDYYNTHGFLGQLSHRQLARYTHKELREKRLTFNTHKALSGFTHEVLGQYKHYQLMMEELDNA